MWYHGVGGNRAAMPAINSKHSPQQKQPLPQQTDVLQNCLQVVPKQIAPAKTGEDVNCLPPSYGNLPRSRRPAGAEVVGFYLKKNIVRRTSEDCAPSHAQAMGGVDQNQPPEFSGEQLLQVIPAVVSEEVQDNVRYFQSIGQNSPNLDHFAYRNNLVMMELRNCKLFVDDVKPIAHCSRLRFLGLAENFLTELPETFQFLENLEMLDVAQNFLAKLDVLSCLTSLPSLVYLHLARNPVADSSLYQLGVVQHCPHLLAIDEFLVGSLQEQIQFIRQFQPQPLKKAMKSYQKNMWTWQPGSIGSFQSSVPAVVYQYLPFNHSIRNTGRMITTKMRILRRMCNKKSPACIITRSMRRYVQARKISAALPGIIKMQAMVRSYLLTRRLDRDMERILKGMGVPNPRGVSASRARDYSDLNSFRPNFYASVIQQYWGAYQRKKVIKNAAIAIQSWVRKELAQRRIISERLRSMRASTLIISSKHTAQFQEWYTIISQKYSKRLDIQRKLGYLRSNDASRDQSESSEAIVDIITNYRFLSDNRMSPIFKRSPGIKKGFKVTIQRIFQFGTPADQQRQRRLRYRRCVKEDLLLFHQRHQKSRAKSQTGSDNEYSSVCYSITFPNISVLYSLWKVCLHQNIPVYSFRQIIKGSAALAIQSVWRSYCIRKYVCTYVISQILARRSAIALQRWWRWQQGLHRRFQLVRNMARRFQSINSHVLYLDSWVYYLLLKQPTLPPVPKTISFLFPEFQCVPFVNPQTHKAAVYKVLRFTTDAMLSSSGASGAEPLGSVSIDHDSLQAQALDTIVGQVREQPSIASEVFEPKVITTYNSGFAQNKLSTWMPWNSGSSGAIPGVGAIQDRSQSLYAIFELLTNDVSVYVLHMNPVDFSELSTPEESEAAGVFPYRIIKLQFSSVREAKVRAALLYLATYDSKSRRGVELMIENELHGSVDAHTAAFIQHHHESSRGADYDEHIESTIPIESRLCLISFLPTWIVSSSYQNINDFVRFHFMCESLLFNGEQGEFERATTARQGQVRRLAPNDELADGIDNRGGDSLTLAPTVMEMASVDSTLQAFLSNTKELVPQTAPQFDGEKLSSAITDEEGLYYHALGLSGLPLTPMGPRHTRTAHALRSPRDYDDFGASTHPPQRPHTTKDVAPEYELLYTRAVMAVPPDSIAYDAWPTSKVLFWCSRSEERVDISRRPRTVGGLAIAPKTILGHAEEVALERLSTLKSARRKRHVMLANASRQSPRALVRTLSGHIRETTAHENAIQRGAKAKQEFKDWHKQEVGRFKEEQQSIEALRKEDMAEHEAQLQREVKDRMLAREDQYVSFLKKRLRHAQDASQANAKEAAVQERQRQLQRERRQTEVAQNLEAAAIDKKVQRQKASHRQFTNVYTSALMTLSRRTSEAYYRDVKERRAKEVLVRAANLKSVPVNRTALHAQAYAVSTVLPRKGGNSLDETEPSVDMDDSHSTVRVVEAVPNIDNTTLRPSSRPSSAHYKFGAAIRRTKFRPLESAIDDLSKPSGSMISSVLHADNSVDQQPGERHMDIHIPRPTTRQASNYRADDAATSARSVVEVLNL